MLVKKNLVFYI